MTRLIICLLLIFVSTKGHSQSLDEIRTLAGKNQLEKALNGINQYLAVEANSSNAEAWQLKSLILYKVVSDATYAHLAPNGHLQSFEAYKKFLDLRTKSKLPLPAEHEVLFGVSFSNIERATHAFQQKKYADALKHFLEVEEMEDFIVKKGLSYQDFSFPAFDTQLYVNIAAAAVNSKREDIALNYYRKIADKKIVSNDFDGIYRYLVDRLDKKGDKPARDKYLGIGMEVYPADPYWCHVMLKDAGTDRKKIHLRYEELIGGQCNNYVTLYNYAIELYNYSFRQEHRPADFAKMQARIPELLKKAIAFQPTAEANLLMAKYQLAMINDLIDNYNDITGNTPDKIKKKENLNVQINQRYDEVALYANRAYDLLKDKKPLAKEEKENLVTASKMLVDYWERKGDKERARGFLIQ